MIVNFNKDKIYSGKLQFKKLEIKELQKIITVNDGKFSGFANGTIEIATSKFILDSLRIKGKLLIKKCTISHFSLLLMLLCGAIGILKP